MVKKRVTWKECRDYTIRNHPPWMNGGGRRSAIMYSSKFTNECQHSESFDPHKISIRMMLEDCNDLKREGMKNASINRYISAVSMILRFSQKVGLISQDWTVPRFIRFSEDEDAQERNAFTADELKRMVIFARDSLMHEDLADIILFAALSGIRQNRILALKENDINFDGNMIRVSNPKAKGVKERWCGLHPTLRPILERRCKEQGRLRLFGDDWIPSSYELKSNPNYDDDAYYKAAADKVRRAFRRCLRYINRTDGTYTFHGLRHTYGTLMIQAGQNIVDVAHHMGHSSTQVTQRYVHANDKKLAEQVASIKFDAADLAIA
mgnify:FL=1